VVTVHKLALSLLYAVAIASSAVAAGSSARAVIGNTVHGTEDDGEFYDYYAPSGAATSKLVSGDVSHGRWTIEGGNLCLNYPGDTKACYRVEIGGGRTTMTDVSSGASFQVQIIHGNPKGL
jgi:hypothetical protein